MFSLSSHSSQAVRSNYRPYQPIPQMKTSTLAFLGLVATSYAAMTEVMTDGGAMASSMGAASGSAVADQTSGAAAGSINDDGAVIAAAEVGAALVSAMTSPYL